jgi:hypothetical protein
MSDQSDPGLRRRVLGFYLFLAGLVAEAIAIAAYVVWGMIDPAPALLNYGRPAAFYFGVVLQLTALLVWLSVFIWRPQKS